MSETEAIRRVFHHTMHLQAPPSRVFPLLCPVREYEWVDGWKCELLHSETGIAELGCVFRTAGPEPESSELWVTSRYEPFRAIDFVRVLDDRRVIRYEISLFEEGDGTTRARWTQVHLGYGPRGRTLVEETPADSFPQLMRWVEEALNLFLTKGEVLPRPSPAR